MKKRKLFIQAVCIVLVVLMLLSISIMVIAPSAWAASSSEIQAEIDDLNNRRDEIQTRMSEIQAEIEGLDFEKANTLEKKEYLDQRNQLAQEELNVIQEQITIIDNMIANVQDDLERARADEAYQRERFMTRVRAMEEKTDAGYMEVLFNATSLTDLLTRLDLVSEVMSYDEQLEKEYIASRERVETLETQAETMFAENAERRQELESKQAQLQTDIDAACALIAQMEQDTDDYEAVLEQEEETQAQVEALIRQKEAELQQARAAEEAARLAALAAQQAAQQQQSQGQAVSGPGPADSSDTASPGSPDASGGSDDVLADSPSSGGDSGSSDSGSTDTSGTWMMWPSYCWTLNDPYGMRVNPVTGKYTMHNGVDIGASSGSSIYAAAGGTVIQAGSNGGYGNCVMVNHGNGYTTLYAHMSSIAVSNGQTVSQGQVLGYVGSTGNTTGPHLHFEVRVSATGATMNPMGFSYF